MNVHVVAAEIATAQHGLVSRRQLSSAGLAGNTIDRFVGQSAVEVVIPGVYRLFDGDPELQQICAAVLSLDRSAADLETAASLHGVPVRHSGLPRLVVRHGHTNRTGLAVVRQTRHLPRIDLCVVEGISALTLARTVCELVPRLSPPAAERLATTAMSSGGLSESELVACEVSMARRGRPGVTKRRERLAPLLTGTDVDLSFLERSFLRRYREAGLPPLETQARPPWFDGVRGVVDFAVVSSPVIIEVDGRSWHDSVDARINDVRRDRRAERHGWRVIRISWDEVMHRWSELEIYLRHVLGFAHPPQSA